MTAPKQAARRVHRRDRGLGRGLRWTVRAFWSRTRAVRETSKQETEAVTGTARGLHADGGSMDSPTDRLTVTAGGLPLLQQDPDWIEDVLAHPAMRRRAR